jgi:hypothetical protein
VIELFSSSSISNDFNSENCSGKSLLCETFDWWTELKEEATRIKNYSTHSFRFKPALSCGYFKCLHLPAKAKGFLCELEYLITFQSRHEFLQSVYLHRLGNGIIAL